MGIIGGMLAGAAEAAGGGLGKLGIASMLKDQETAADQEKAARLAEHQTSIETQREAGHMARTELTEKGAEKRTQMQIGANKEEGQATRDFQLNLHNQAERNAIDRLQQGFKHTEAMTDKQMGQARALAQPGMDLHNEQLKAIREIGVLRVALKNSVVDGDKAGADSYKRQIEALGYSNDVKDTQGLIAIAGAAGKLATSFDASPEDRQMYGKIMKDALAAAQSNKSDTAPNPATGPEIKYDKDGNAFVKGADGKPMPYTPPSAAKPAAAAARPGIVANAQDRYQKALKELNSMKGGLLPTPRGSEGAIKAKEAEVNALLQEANK